MAEIGNYNITDTLIEINTTIAEIGFTGGALIQGLITSDGNDFYTSEGDIFIPADV